MIEDSENGFRPQSAATVARVGKPPGEDQESTVGGGPIGQPATLTKIRLAGRNHSSGPCWPNTIEGVQSIRSGKFIKSNHRANMQFNRVSVSIAILFVMCAGVSASLTLTELDLATGEFEVTNTSDVTVSGALLEWCVPFVYGVSEGGAFDFAPGEVRTYSANRSLSNADDFWLYLDRTGGFGNTSTVTSGVVWGSSQAGQGRVNSVVQNTGGAAWASNTDFVDISGLEPGQTLQAIFPGDSANTSAGWTIGPANFGSFGAAAPSGDFDGNGLFDCMDIDALSNVISEGIGDLSFDMNGDGTVDSADGDEWLAVAGAENLPSGNPYIRGDGNLDGFVDASDFNIWNQGRFTVSSSYCSGDYNFDGVIDASDFNLWNEAKFTASDTQVVPEPEGLLMML